MAESLLFVNFWPQYGGGRVAAICRLLTTIRGWPSRYYLSTFDHNTGVAESLLFVDFWPQYGGGRVAIICGLLTTIRVAASLLFVDFWPQYGWPSRYYVWTFDHNTGGRVATICGLLTTIRVAESLLFVDFWLQYGWPSCYGVSTSHHKANSTDVGTFTIRCPPQERLEDSNGAIRSRKSKTKIQYHGHKKTMFSIILH
jgi:hypothetical protein